MALLEGKITKDLIPKDWSLEAADFINKLIKKKIKERLGYNGISEIKNHSWLNSIDWNKLYNKKIIPPFKPKPGDNYDFKTANKKDSILKDSENGPQDSYTF